MLHFPFNQVHDTGVTQYSTVGPKFELCLEPVDSFEMYQPTCHKLLQYKIFYGKDFRLKKPVRRMGSLLVYYNCLKEGFTV